MSIDLCPICIENPAINFTECNHGFCIGCLSRIKKCAMCRNPLQRAKLCIQIQENFNLNEEINDDVIYSRITTRNGIRGGHHSYIEITLPQITPIRRHYNISPRSITRISMRGA
jgi:hypothetical protein